MNDDIRAAIAEARAGQQAERDRRAEDLAVAVADLAKLDEVLAILDGGTEPAAPKAPAKKATAKKAARRRQPSERSSTGRGNGPKGQYPCPFCDRVFDTPMGRGGHKGKAHPGQTSEPAAPPEPQVNPAPSVKADPPPLASVKPPPERAHQRHRQPRLLRLPRLHRQLPHGRPAEPAPAQLRPRRPGRQLT